jgi:enoyl-CoA hydratase/carnithine racemase
MSAPTAARIGDVVVELEGRVLTATIDRPQKRNAISPSVIEGLSGAIEMAQGSDATVVVLRGAGGTFCAGADLGFVSQSIDDPSVMTDFLVRLSEVCDRLVDGPFASIAVIEGFAVAGGCELLVACDLAVAADDAQIGDGHLKNALLPGAGNSVRLLQALSPARARRLFYTAELITGREAAEWGLVSASAPAGELDRVVAGIVSQIAGHSPAALRAVKQMTICAETKPMAQALADERRIFLEYAEEDDHVRNALTAFLNRRSTPQGGQP